MITHTENIKRVQVTLEAEEQKTIDEAANIIYNIQKFAEEVQDEYLTELCYTVINNIGEIQSYENELFM